VGDSQTDGRHKDGFVDWVRSQITQSARHNGNVWKCAHDFLNDYESHTALQIR